VIEFLFKAQRKSEENSHLQRGADAAGCAMRIARLRRAAGYSGARRPRTIRALTQTLKKKALQAQQHDRNNLRMCPHVLFFRAIRYARCGPRAWVKTLEE